jgi:hypothetical protein
MQVRKLRKLLNDTTYSIADYGAYIGIGSPYVHDLIKVTKDGWKVSYALDTFKKGRSSISHKPLEEIWDKLLELIASGELQKVVEANDEIETKIQVFRFDEATETVIESHTDTLGWPNTTFDGQMMYENEWFPTKEEAITREIRCLSSGMKYSEETVNDLKERYLKCQARHEKDKSLLENLKTMYPELAKLVKGE